MIGCFVTCGLLRDRCSACYYAGLVSEDDQAKPRLVLHFLKKIDWHGDYVILPRLSTLSEGHIIEPTRFDDTVIFLDCPGETLPERFQPSPLHLLTSFSASI